MRISHGAAVSLEFAVRRVYKCERGGFCGIIDADIFESNPMLASLLVFAPIIYNSGENAEIKAFMDKYFLTLQDGNALSKDDEENYVRDFIKIVDNLYAK